VEKLDRLLNAYVAGTVGDDAFKAKTAELKAETARVTDAIDAEGDVATSLGKDNAGSLCMEPKGGQNLARFKHHGSLPHPGFDLFEPTGEQRNLGYHKDRAVRLFGQTARCAKKSGL
jgi:hypothetical protein